MTKSSICLTFKKVTVIVSAFSHVQYSEASVSKALCVGKDIVRRLNTNLVTRNAGSVTISGPTRTSVTESRTTMNLF